MEPAKQEPAYTAALPSHAGLDLSLDDMIKRGGSAAGGRGRGRGRGHPSGGRGAPFAGRAFPRENAFAARTFGGYLRGAPPDIRAPPYARPRASMAERLGPPPAAAAPQPRRRDTPETLHAAEDGSLRLRWKGYEVLSVSFDGALTLYGGPERGLPAQGVLSDALGVLGLKLLVSPAGWSVSDGAKLLKRFEDGVTLPPPKLGSEEGLPRAMRLRRAYGDPLQPGEEPPGAQRSGGGRRRGGSGGGGGDGRGRRYSPY